MKTVLKIAVFSAIVAGFGFQVQAADDTKGGDKHQSLHHYLKEFHEADCHKLKGKDFEGKKECTDAAKHFSKLVASIGYEASKGNAVAEMALGALNAFEMDAKKKHEEKEKKDDDDKKDDGDKAKAKDSGDDKGSDDDKGNDDKKDDGDKHKAKDSGDDKGGDDKK